MSDEKLPLIIHPGSGLARVGPQVGRILAEMVSGALALSRAASSLVPQFRICDHEFCEPDYQQILLWAEALELKPETVIERLLIDPTDDMWDREDATQFAGGRIVKLGWDTDSLPWDSFEWVDGLVIEALNFFGPEDHVPIKRWMTLPLPKLRILECSSMGLIGLNLSGVPHLERLRCAFNQLEGLDLSTSPELTDLNCEHNSISELDLSAVPLLTDLYCSYNRLTELDLSPIPILASLGCYGNGLNILNLSGVPRLKRLSCMYNWIAKLDLAAVPNLIELDCNLNSLRELDLSAVPHLKSLDCRDNPLVELDIRPLMHLEKLYYDAQKTRLIQRSDQNF